MLIGPTADKGNPYVILKEYEEPWVRQKKMRAVATVPNVAFPYIAFICGYIAFQASYNVVTQLLRIRIRFGDPLRAW